MCPTAEGYRSYTGFDRVEDDDDDLVSSLSASKRAGIFRPNNGGEHPKSSYDSFQKSARREERPAPGALFN